MATIFKADKSFVDYITMSGLIFKEVDSEKRYYTKQLNDGKVAQIRIDFERGIITLLNKFGIVVDSNSTFSSTEIDLFIGN